MEKRTKIIWGIVLTILAVFFMYLSWINGFDEGFTKGRDDMFNSCVNFVCDIHEADGYSCIKDIEIWNESKQECINILFYEGDIVGGEK